MKNQITLTAETDFKDNELREWVHKLQGQVDTLIERTKRQTKEIQELRRKLK